LLNRANPFVEQVDVMRVTAFVIGVVNQRLRER
jgi:hypothetical protein